jgi:ATP-dependent Clp protease protease subunit
VEPELVPRPPAGHRPPSGDGPGRGVRPAFEDQVLASLLGRRIVVVHGDLDGDRASETAATLMTLDALGDEHIELRLHAPGGTLEAAMVLIDVIDVLGVPVHTTALGVVGGGAVGVLAAGARRVIAPHARLHLRQPDITTSGRSADLQRSIAEHTSRRDEFYRFLAARTGRPVADIEEQWAHGVFLDADGAVGSGYVDAIAVSGG